MIGMIMNTPLPAIVTAGMMWYAGCAKKSIVCLLGFLYRRFLCGMRIKAQAIFGRKVSNETIPPPLWKRFFFRCEAWTEVGRQEWEHLLKQCQLIQKTISVMSVGTVRLDVRYRKQCAWTNGRWCRVFERKTWQRWMNLWPSPPQQRTTQPTIRARSFLLRIAWTMLCTLCVWQQRKHMICTRVQSFWVRRPGQPKGEEDRHNVYDDESSGTPFNGDEFRRIAQAKVQNQQFGNRVDEPPPLLAAVSDDDSSDDDSSDDESFNDESSDDDSPPPCDSAPSDNSPPSSVPSTTPASSFLSSSSEEKSVVECEKVVNADSIDMSPETENDPSPIPARVSRKLSPPSSSVDISQPSSVPSTTLSPPVPAPSSLSNEESVEEEYEIVVETFPSKKNGPSPIPPPARVSPEPSPPSSSVDNSQPASIPSTSSSPPVPAPSSLSNEESIEEEYKIVVETVEEIELEKVVNADAIELFPSKGNGPSPIPAPARVSPEPSQPTSSVDNSPPSPLAPSSTSASRQCKAPDESVQMEIEMRECPVIHEACAMELETDLGNVEEYPIDTSEPMDVDVDEEYSVYYMDTTEPMDFETTFSESEVMMDVSVFQ